MEYNGSLQQDIIRSMLSVNKLYAAEQRKENSGMKIRNPYKPLLYALCEKDNITQLEITKATGIQGPTVSLISRRMEREGYIKRRVCDSDLRKSYITITEKGRSLADSLRATEGTVEMKMLADFSDAELDMLDKAFNKMTENLKKQ